MKQYMKQYMKAILVGLVAMALLLGCASSGSSSMEKSAMGKNSMNASTMREDGMQDSVKPKYIFFFIGDGNGMPQRSLAEYYKNTVMGDPEPLVMHTLPISADISTHSSSTLITDSGAAATALSSGYKTYNGAIGVDNNETPQVTLLEALADKGFVTGLITTTRMTHATPATFASHQPSRSMENEIARDYLNEGVDFLAGGGYRHFVGADSEFKSKRKDSGLIKEYQEAGYTTYLSESNTEKFLTDTITKADKVLGLFAYSHIPYAVDRDELAMEGKMYPSLDQMTSRGIEFLYDKGMEDGFFLMVEGGRIDHASHANDPLATATEVLEFDMAIAEALDFYMEHPDETLIIVTADHETGGLSLGGRLNDFDENGQSTQEYALFLGELVGNQSLEDVVGSKFKDLGYNRDAFIQYLEMDYGLGKLSNKERMLLEMAMDDESDDNPDNDYGIYYSKTSLAVSQIVSLRANIGWSTELHTAVRIPLGALGPGAHTFSGYYGNHQVPMRLAQLIGVTTPIIFEDTCEEDLTPAVDRFSKDPRASNFVTD